MAYSPINNQAFTAAFSGAVSGMAVNGWITSPTGSNYTLVCNVAGAFAQAFDVAWNDATALNGLEYSAIQQACAQEFSLRGPGPLASSKFSDPANWAVPAKACATLALQCDLYFAGQGITPPALSRPSLFSLMSAGTVIAPVAPGGDEPTNPVAVPYSLQADEVMIVEVSTRITTASLPAPATSYFNLTMGLELSVDGGGVFNAVAFEQYVTTMAAPPDPNADAPGEYPVSMKYQLVPLGAPPTGDQLHWRARFQSNAASTDSYSTFDVQLQFTQGKLIQ